MFTSYINCLPKRHRDLRHQNLQRRPSYSAVIERIKPKTSTSSLLRGVGDACRGWVSGLLTTGSSHVDRAVASSYAVTRRHDACDNLKPVPCWLVQFSGSKLLCGQRPHHRLPRAFDTLLQNGTVSWYIATINHLRVICASRRASYRERSSRSNRPTTRRKKFLLSIRSRSHSYGASFCAS